MNECKTPSLSHVLSDHCSGSGETDCWLQSTMNIAASQAHVVQYSDSSVVSWPGGEMFSLCWFYVSQVLWRTEHENCRCLVQCFVWNKKHVRSSQFGVCSITFSRVTFRVTFIIATWCNSCISCISTQESHNKLFLEGKLNKYDNVHLHFLHKLFSDEKFFWALRNNLFWLVSNVVHFSGKFRIKLSWTWRYSDKMFQDTQILGKPHCSSAILITHILTQP